MVEAVVSAAPPCELTILMPCLDEAETIGECVDAAMSFLDRHGIAGEVLVADNGSRDGSPAIAAARGATVIHVTERGYGNALLGGIRAAAGRYVIMGDADASYDLASLMPFLEMLRGGTALVMGNRFQGGIEPGAMPPLHRYLGNPLLTAAGRLFFRSPCGDFHCGLRGFDRAAILGLDLRTGGMEFASEMVVKATLHHLSIGEVPTVLRPDGRSRRPHLRTWRDGWRHLRFLLMYSPRWLFFYPGLLIAVIGLLAMAMLVAMPVTIGRVTFDIHTLVLSGLMMSVGVDTMIFWVLTKEFAINQRLLQPDPAFDRFSRRLTVEVTTAAGLALMGLGLAGLIGALLIWQAAQFGELSSREVMRVVVPAATAMAIGFQVLMAGFFKGVLGLTRPPA